MPQHHHTSSPKLRLLANLRGSLNASFVAATFPLEGSLPRSAKTGLPCLAPAGAKRMVPGRGLEPRCCLRHRLLRPHALRVYQFHHPGNEWDGQKTRSPTRGKKIDFPSEKRGGSRPFMWDSGKQEAPSHPGLRLSCFPGFRIKSFPSNAPPLHTPVPL